MCRSWYALAQHIAPEQLTFEFDLLAQDRDDGSGGAPASQRSLLQALLSTPQRLLLRATGHATAPAPAAPPQLQAAPAASLPPAGADVVSSQEHEFSLQNEPWAAWLRQRGGRLQDFAMTITNLDSNCAAAQCQLKETLLRALADSAPAAPGALASRSTKAGGNTDKLLLLSSGGSGASSNSNSGSDLLETALYHATHAGSDCSSSDSGDSSSPSQPGSPLSTSTDGGFESCVSSAPATSAATAAVTSTSHSHSTAISTLQLRSLHLKVPLFEYDVLLLANICSKAPALRSLSLVGYSSSGAVTTRAGKASPDARGGSSAGGSDSASSGAGCLCRSNRPQLFAASSGRSFPGTAAAAAAAASSAGGSAAGNAAAREGPAQQQPTSRKAGMGRGGFITGSSLKHLVAAVPQLERLTFACRQLYKLSWLAPATQLTFLSLRDCSLGPNLLTELAGLKLPRLRGLDMSGSKGLGGAEASDHLRLLARIGGGGLEQLDISGWDLSAVPSRAMPQLAALRMLDALKMECCGLKGWELEAGALPRLTALSLSGNALDCHGIAAACAITQLQSLELGQVAPRELMLMQQVPAQAQGPLCWAGMRPMPQLTHLSLAGNAWPDSSLPERGPMLPYRCFKQDLRAALAGMPQLMCLDLSECKVPYKALPLLLVALPASVTELVLDSVAEGLRSADLEALADLPRLAVLSAAGCNIRDKHVAVLTKLHRLHRLSLRNNAGLGPDGVCAIVESCDQLTLLDLGGGRGRVGSSASVRAAIAARGNLLLATRD